MTTTKTNTKTLVDELLHARAYGLTSINLVLALLIIRENKHTTLGQLATEIRISIAAITHIADSLVKSNLATRERFVGDRRAYHLVITRLGTQIADSLKS